MNARWLTLPLTARGLYREILSVVGESGSLDTALDAGVPASTVGGEVARLLCAFPHEHARVKRDVVVLLERGFLAFEDSLLRIGLFEVDQSIDDEHAIRSKVPSESSSAKRMRDFRARRRALATGSSPVTLGDVTGDAFSDGGDASRSLSPKSFNEISTRESSRERHADVTGDAGDGPSVRRCVTRDTPFDANARAIADKIGVRNPEAVWFGFTAHYAGKPLEREWEDLWQKWVARQVTWDRASSQTEEAAIDTDAPWMRKAMGGTP